MNTEAQKKNGNPNIYKSLTRGQTPSADEDDVIRLKAQAQLLNGAFYFAKCCFQGQE